MALDPARLVTAATEAAGHADFNGDDWREGFSRLVEAFNERPFHEKALAEIEATLIKALVSRLKMEAWITQHREVEDEVIDGPVVIMGLPRTASTALQNILAEDARWRLLRGWESLEPAPPPVLDQEREDERYLQEKALLDADTTYDGKHIQVAGGPVEDTALLRLNFGAQEQGWPLYNYTRWWRDQPQRATFAYQRRAMQLLQSRRPPNRWVLKSPPHCFHLGDLLAVHPGARLIMTHRNPVDIIPSTCSLLYTRFRLFLAEEDVDRAELGRWVMEHWSRATARALAFRRSHPEAEVFDIHHRSFNQDPFGVLKGLYHWLGAELTPAAERSMADWSNRHRRGAKGEHRYKPEDFGLTTREIEAAFADYIQAYDV